MTLNLSSIWSAIVGQQGSALLRVLCQGVCIDAIWNPCEKVVRKIIVACPDTTQLLSLFWNELHNHTHLLLSHTSLQLCQTYFSWVLVPFVVSLLKSQYVQLMANRNHSIQDGQAEQAFLLGVASTTSWRAWGKSLFHPLAWNAAFYQGVKHGQQIGNRRKYDFSVSALII